MWFSVDGQRERWGSPSPQSPAHKPLSSPGVATGDSADTVHGWGGQTRCWAHLHPYPARVALAQPLRALVSPLAAPSSPKPRVLGLRLPRGQGEAPEPFPG